MIVENKFENQKKLSEYIKKVEFDKENLLIGKSRNNFDNYTQITESSKKRIKQQKIFDFFKVQEIKPIQTSENIKFINYMKENYGYLDNIRYSVHDHIKMKVNFSKNQNVMKNFHPLQTDNQLLGFINERESVLYLKSENFLKENFLEIKNNMILMIPKEITNWRIFKLVTGFDFIKVNGIAYKIDDLEDCMKIFNISSKNTEKEIIISQKQNLLLFRDSNFNSFIISPINHIDLEIPDIIPQIKEVLNPIVANKKKIEDILWFFDDNIPKTLENLIPLTIKYNLIRNLDDLQKKNIQHMLSEFFS